MKKRYNVTLDQESTEELQRLLDKSGQSLSSFLSALVVEYVEAMRLLTKKLPSDASKVELGTFLQLFSGMVKKMSVKK